MTAADPADAIIDALGRLRPRHRHDGRPHGDPRAHGEGRLPHIGRGEQGGFLRGGPARMRMLEALAAASAPCSVSEIGEAVGVDQPRASRLVQQGVELGLVAREVDPNDARRTRIALTEQGRGIAQGIRGQRRKTIERALESFSDEEQRELARLLSKLADHIAAQPKEGDA